MISSVHFGSVTLENRSLINTVTGEGTILQEFGCIDFLVSFYSKACPIDFMVLLRSTDLERAAFYIKTIL